MYIYILYIDIYIYVEEKLHEQTNGHIRSNESKLQTFLSLKTIIDK